MTHTIHELSLFFIFFSLSNINELHVFKVTGAKVRATLHFLPHVHGRPGRPRADRAALSRAFLAKTIFNIDDTLGLIERLHKASEF